MANRLKLIFRSSAAHSHSLTQNIIGIGYIFSPQKAAASKYALISEPIFGLEKSASALSRSQKAKSALLFTHSTAELPKYQQAAVQLISVEMLSNTVNTGVFRRRCL
jgi:hypothetical protein